MLFFLFLSACATPETSQQEKIKESNAKGEFIYRKADERYFSIPFPKHYIRERYPWEHSLGGQVQKITKDYFRCKGSHLNPYRKVLNDSEYLADCQGGHRHSLPLKDGKEFIYPILIELLNYLQEKTRKQVVITCGHRCPKHNRYADESIANQSSKHQIGAEVDFYLKGKEQDFDEIVQILIDFYKFMPRYEGKKEYVLFERDEKNQSLRTLPWYNKEIYIKLFHKDEGRDLDNRHPYPYLCLQVRYDRELNQRVVYSWDQAFKGYMRN